MTTTTKTSDDVNMILEEGGNGANWSSYRLSISDIKTFI